LSSTNKLLTANTKQIESKRNEITKLDKEQETIEREIEFLGKKNETIIQERQKKEREDQEQKTINSSLQNQIRPLKMREFFQTTSFTLLTAITLGYIARLFIISTSNK